MDIGKYGQFATIIAAAGALFAAFSMLLMKTIGKVAQWTWLTQDAPPFMLTTGARALSIALIAATYISIGPHNYGWFAGAAIVFGAITLILIASFDRLRGEHVCKVPLLNPDGTQARSFWRKPKFEMIVIGKSNQMRREAAIDYEKLGSISLCQFMSGYGRNSVNDPAAIWTMETLANVRNRINMTLVGIFLCAVMSLYLAAAAIEVNQRASSKDKAVTSVTSINPNAVTTH